MTARSPTGSAVAGRRLCLAVLLATALAACSSTPRVARHPAPVPQPPPTEEVLASLDSVAESDLETVRGGFEVNGLSISIGLSIAARVAEAGGGFSDVTTRLSLPSSGSGEIETSRTSNLSGAVVTQSETQQVTRQQATAFLNNLQLEVTAAGAKVTQDGLQTVIRNSLNNANISHTTELTVGIKNVLARAQSLRQSLSARDLIGRIPSFDLSR